MTIERGEVLRIGTKCYEMTDTFIPRAMDTPQDLGKVVLVPEKDGTRHIYLINKQGNLVKLSNRKYDMGEDIYRYGRPVTFAKPSGDGYIAGSQDGAEGADIEVAFLGDHWTPEFKEWTAFVLDWLSYVIHSDFGPAFDLGDRVVDDLFINGTIEPIDGRGQVLGSAGPRYLHKEGKLTLTGSFRFDVDDINFRSRDYYKCIQCHEVLHILGFGPLWSYKGLIDKSDSADWRFIGEHAVLAYGAAVPIEMQGGSGTQGVHWRESVDTFRHDLMSGYATGAMIYSKVTHESLRDLGYSPRNWDATIPFEMLRGSL